MTLTALSNLLRTLTVVFLAPVIAILWLPLISELICLARRRVVADEKKPRRNLPRLLFLVPAHNEELLIGACVRSLVTMKYHGPSRRVVVVADNCTDDTVRVARSAGAEVLERVNATQPGKPNAIAWALGGLDLKEWDACVVIDADSTVAPGFALGLSKLAPLNDIAFQANFGVLNEFESWLTRLGGVLSRCRYEVTYPLKQAAGLNCPITGNGMGFGTNLLMREGWRAFSLAEDSELYAAYTAKGIRIHHASSANLHSQEARSLNQSATQRRRWLAGRIHILRKLTLPLLRSPHIGWHQKLDAIVELGLAIPVLHLLAATMVSFIGLVIIGGVAGNWLAALAAASLAGVVSTALIVILRHPQPWRTVAAFTMLPFYAAWRLALVARTMMTLGDTTWRKTARTAPLLGTRM